MSNPAKFDRCVRKVRRKSRGRVNAYAVCTAAGARNPYQWPYYVSYGLNVDGHQQFEGPDARKRALEFAQEKANETGWAAYVSKGTRGSMVKTKSTKVKPTNRTNPGAQRYNSDPFDGFDEKSFEESQEGRFGNLRGFSKRVGRGFPVTVLQKVRTRSLVRVDHFGESHYGWLNNEEIVTEQKFLKRFGYPPEGKVGHKSNPESSASDMYSSFHGSPSEEVVEFREEEHYHGNLAGLGVLVELKLVTTTGYDVTLTFSDPEALIAANPKTTAKDYLSEIINFGGEMIPRGDAYKRLIATAKEQGHKDPKLMADRWMQGYDRTHNPSVWDRLKSIGSRSTVYQVPARVEKMVKVASAKGHEIFKTVHGDYRVPSLERESSFDTLGDAKKFVGAWKGNPKTFTTSFASSLSYKAPHPERTAKKSQLGIGGDMVFQEWTSRPAMLKTIELQGRRASRQGDWKPLIPFGQWPGDSGENNPGPFQSASTVLGKTGKYLDDQLGRVLNPRPAYYVVEHLRDGMKKVYAGPYASRDIAHRQGPIAKMGLEILTYKQVEALERARKLVGGDWRGWTVARERKQNPSQDPTLLCSNESGTQLYLQGGDQAVDLKTIHMADVPLKDSMVLGEAYFISYFTTKDFDGHAPTIYEHDLAEESDPPKPKYRKDEIHTAANRPGMGQGLGCYPMVRYDYLNQKLYLDGGEYKIEKPLLNTSPGIEN